jgi:DNA-binding transcriptional MerR regulator
MPSPALPHPGEPSLWTLEELRALAETILLSEGITPPSGRVRAVPDRRTLRYYTTLGLLAPPAGFRGRTALYGSAHVAQVVLIKRLQVEGLPLAGIQERLAGMTPVELERLARLPEPLPDFTARLEVLDGPEEPSSPEPESPASAPAQAGSWIHLGQGVTLLLPETFQGGGEDLLLLLRSAAPLLAELRRQGLTR